MIEQAMSAPASAAAAANTFLDFYRSEPVGAVPSVDQMKLQKLLFYGHAWHLAIRLKPLFEEDVEAWPYGPVVRNVWLETKDAGRGPVTKMVRDLRIDPNSLAHGFSTPRVEDKQTFDFLRSVWEAHKAYTGIQLSNATHAPGEPWTIVKEQFGNLSGKPTIPNDLIRSVFRAKLPSTVAA